MRALTTSARGAMLAALALLPIAAMADRDGHGKHHGGKQTYWDGNCKVEIKEKHGRYEEKRKCKGPQAVYVAPQPVVVMPQPAPVVVDPGVVIQGTIHVR